MSSAPLDNQRSGRQQSESGLPLALIIHEGRDEDTFLASVTRQGEALIFELDDGRTIEIDRRELLDRAA